MLIFVQKDTERSPFLDEIGTRAGKRYGTGSEPGAVGKCTGKDNFSGGKNHFGGKFQEMIITLFIDPFMQSCFCRLLEYADA